MADKPQEKPAEKKEPAPAAPAPATPAHPTAAAAPAPAAGHGKADAHKDEAPKPPGRIKILLQKVKVELQKIKPWVLSKKIQVIETIKNIKSEDPSTRQAARAFVASVSLALCLLLYGVGLLGVRRWEASRKHVVVEVPVVHSSSAPHWILDPINVPLKKPFRRFPIRSAAPNAMVELSVECDTDATCQFLKDHLPQAKDRILGVLFGAEPDDFLTTEGKRSIQARLVEALQYEVHHGKVREVYFLNLSVE